MLLTKSKLAIMAVVMAVSLPHMGCRPSNNNSKGIAEKAKKRYCGPNLTHALSVLCKLPYTMELDDTVANQVFLNVALASQQMEIIPPRYNNDDDSRLERFSRRERRFRRGIVDECCRTSCNLFTLRLYCGNNGGYNGLNT